jgi:hypothetical protein
VTSARIAATTTHSKFGNARSSSQVATLDLGRLNALTLDGKPAAYHKSSGIGHATKSKTELGVGGKDGFFDDIKVWNAEPAKP